MPHYFSIGALKLFIRIGSALGLVQIFRDWFGSGRKLFGTGSGLDLIFWVWSSFFESGLDLVQIIRDWFRSDPDFLGQVRIWTGFF